MDKLYERINWENEPSVSTPVNETNLNRMDYAVDELDNRVISLDTKKISKAETTGDIVDVSLDEDTGIFTFIRRDGSTLPFDTKLEKITTNWTFDEEAQKIILTLDDGTKQEIDLSKLITIYEFLDSDTIAFSVNGSGKVTAIVKNGSITEAHLQPNYLADIKVESAKAVSASQSASASATASSASAQESNTYATQSEASRAEAEESATSAYASATNAKSSEDKAKVSETNAKVSETNAKISEENAQRVAESLPEDYTDLSKAFYNTAIKQKAVGDNIHVTDSAEAKNIEFGLYGKAEQKQYSGKNLLQITTTSQTVKGVTFTVDNGCITVNGTATETFFIEIGRANALEAGNYTISGCPNGGSETTFNFEAVSVKAGSNDWVTRYIEYGNEAQGRINGTDSQAFIANIRIRSGVTVNNLVFKPMIRLASITDDTYEPYVGGIASPNPDYPQEITVSGSDGSVEVVSCGKNLLKNMATTQTVNGVTFTVNGGSITLNGTATSEINYTVNSGFVLPKGKYMFSQGGSLGNSGLYIANINGASDWFYANVKGREFEVTMQSTIICKFYIPSGVTANNVVIYPMIRPAFNTDSTYEPYRAEPTVSTIPTPNGLAGIKVSSGGNYTDENGQQWSSDVKVKYANGSGNRIQRIASVDMGTLNWSYDGKHFVSKDLIGIVKEPNTNKVKCHALSTCFGVESYEYMVQNNNMLSIIWSESTSHGQIWVKATDYTDKSSFLEMVSGQYLYYELAEPIITDLSAEEIAEIEKLHTFYPITNISNDADCGMSITYLCDVKNYIDNRLAQIESAMINNI